MEDILYKIFKDEYNRCMEKFKNLKTEVKETTDSIRQVAEGIQCDENTHRVGRLFYSSTGIIGGGLGIAGIALAPVTLGLSLALSIAGTAVGLSSGAANIIHTNVKDSKIKSKVKNATESLERFNQKWEEFRKNLDELQLRVQDTIDELNRFARENNLSVKEIAFLSGSALTGACSLGNRIHDLVRFSKALHLLNMGVTDDIAAAVLKNGVRLSAKVLIPIAAVFILWEIGNIIHKSTQIHKQTLHTKAEELYALANQIEENWDCVEKQLSEVFPDV